MKKLILFCYAHLVFGCAVYPQHNMLGKSQKYIRSFFELSSEFSLKVDTLSKRSILLSYKPEKQYPFYTYEINTTEDVCVSYGVVSKDPDVLRTYIDILNYIGEVVEMDSTYNNFTYKVATNKKVCFYSIKQPYFNSQFLTRRSLFYILVTEQTVNNNSEKTKNKPNP